MSHRLILTAGLVFTALIFLQLGAQTPPPNPPNQGDTPTPYPPPANPPAGQNDAAPPPPDNASPAPASSDDATAAPAQDSEFLIDNVPYAKVLAMTGTVEIRPPGETAYRALTLDEPIAVGSVLHTGFFSTLDLATAVGMAVRLTPRSTVEVKTLPNGTAGVTPAPDGTAASPSPAQLDLKQGTIISALGRDDGNAIDFQVATPQGVAAARGTMFAVSTNEEGSEVNMLHGTVNFETPDHQTSSITAGDSQQISGTGGQFHFGERHPFSSEKAERLYTPAGGLLEHANGYGIVRRGLGEDTVNALEKRGFHFSPEAHQRFMNARHQRYQRKAFNAQRRAALEQRREQRNNLNPKPARDEEHPYRKLDQNGQNNQNRDSLPGERERRREDGNGDGNGAGGGPGGGPNGGGGGGGRGR